VAPAAPEEPTPEPVSKSFTILLCEDDDHVRHLVETALSARGHKLLTAATPDQALELADRHAAELDLLVTDVIMPGMNGYQLYERVAAQRPGLRVVFMSGHTDQVAVPPDQPQPGVGFLQKPFALKALYRAVETE
jgi:two-component system cell cycle sensor histidine kinase/response regulator CckA